MKSLRQLLETAFVGYLSKAVGGNVEFKKGLGSMEVNYPCVVASFLSGEEIHPQAATFTCEVLVTVVSSANKDTEAGAESDHDEFFGKVVGALEVEELNQLLMAAEPDLLCNGIVRTTENQPDIDNDENNQPIFSSGYSVELIAGHK